MFGITKIQVIATAMITLFGSSTLCAQDIKPIQVELPADPLVVQPLRKLMEAVSANNSRIRSLEAGTGVTQPAEIEVELRLKPDQSSERVERLIEDLSGLGITRFRLAGPFENQNMAVIGAPEDSPWTQIHELTVFLTNQRDFRFDIRMRISDKLPTSTQKSESEEIEATLLRLDELPASLQVPLRRSKPELQIPVLDNPKGTSAEFRRRLIGLEKPVLQLAEQVRTTEKSMGKDHPESVKHRSELRSLVQQTFAARQDIQRSELAEFTRRLERMQQSIDARDRIAEKIVDRRVEELLNPELSWEQVGVKRSAPDVLPTFAREVDPATSPDRKVPAAIGQDSSAGITVTVPVSTAHYLIGELQKQIGHDRISLLAEKVPATTPAGTTGSFTIVLCNNCRLEAVEVVPESNGQRLATRLFVPMDDGSDFVNQILTQQQIDQLASLGAEFKFDNLRLVDSAADSPRKASDRFQIQLRCENQISPDRRYTSLTADGHVARFNMAVDEFMDILIADGERLVPFQLSFEPNSRSELSQSWLKNNALTVEFSVEDQQRIAAGEFMVKVIYLESEGGQTGTITSHEMDSGVHPVVAAKLKGTVLGVIRISRKS